MTKLPQVEPVGACPPDRDAHLTRTPDRAVEHAVLARLGRPPGLYGVAVRPLWENRFRVNVLVGRDVTTVRIAHSYFVEAADSGEILSAVPLVTRLYP